MDTNRSSTDKQAGDAKSTKARTYSYEIEVKTGFIYGPGEEANVQLKLYGEKESTSWLNLRTLCKDGITRGHTHKAVASHDKNIGKVVKVELKRDDTRWVSIWYFDGIEVTNMTTEEHSIFSAMRWILRKTEYVFYNMDTMLPQNDPNPLERQTVLENMRKNYQLKVVNQELPAQVRDLPNEEMLEYIDQARMGLHNYVYTHESEKLVKSMGKKWKSLKDVESVYNDIFGKPEGSHYYNDDASFGRQRLTGLNPSLIELVKTIPEGFKDSLINHFKDELKLQEAINKNTLFKTDLKILEGCPTRSKEYKMTCPIAIFHFTDESGLMPIAIKLFQKTTDTQLNPIFVPSCKNVWLLAKMWYNLADSTYHQALTHLNFTHLMMEGISVATKRNLAPSHPIMKLLNPHFKYIMAINSMAIGTLTVENGIIDKTSNAGMNGHYHIMKKSMTIWRLNQHGTLPNDLTSRGVDNPEVLKGAYHMRDDALLLYDAIKTYVKSYVELYYTDKDNSIQDDTELKKWGQELVRDRVAGENTNCGVGILGVPNNGSFKTVEDIVSTLTPIIYTCSVGHAAANFQQFDEYGAPFHYPYTLKGDPPSNKDANITDQDIVDAIANREELLDTISVAKILSEKSTHILGDFEKYAIVDPKATPVVEQFQKDLRKVGREMDERNKHRDPKYVWLHPTAIPNSISI